MGSYPLVLDARESPGFKGLNQGVNNFENIYFKSLMDKAEREAKLKGELTLEKQKASDLKDIYKTKQETEDSKITPSDTYLAALGMADPTKTGIMSKRMGLQPKTLPAEDNPLAAMSLAAGGVGDASGNEVGPVAQPMNKTLQDAITASPYLKASQGAQRMTYADEANQRANERLSMAEDKANPTFDSDTTAKVAAKIKSQDDIDELMKNKKEYEAAGVDVAGVLKSHLNNPDQSIVQKIMNFFKGD